MTREAPGSARRRIDFTPAGLRERGVALRPATEDDRALLLRVYASTREEELSVLDWSDDERAAFLAQQFHARDVHYRTHHAEAQHDVVELDGEPVGRIYVDWEGDDVRVVDVALLPRWRGRGIGGALMRGVMDEAASRGKPVSIHVERLNPARRLYERLGFREVTDKGVYLLLEWRPDDVS